MLQSESKSSTSLNPEVLTEPAASGSQTVTMTKKTRPKMKPWLSLPSRSRELDREQPVILAWLYGSSSSVPALNGRNGKTKRTRSPKS